MNKLNHLIRHTYAKSIALLMFFMMMISNTYSQTSEVASTAASTATQSGLSLWSSPLFWVYSFAIFGLLLVIIAIGSVLVGLVNNKLAEKIGKGAAVKWPAPTSVGLQVYPQQH